MSVDVQSSELKGVFRDNLRFYRQLRGLTQEDLADALGVAQSYISELESGKKGPLVETLAQFAEALGTTPAKLVTPRPRKKVAG